MKKEMVHLENSCGNVSLDGLDIDSDKLRSLRAKEYDKSSEHPTPEMLLIREAVKYLTPKQREAWEYANYDKLTEDQIAKKLKISRDSAHDRLEGAQKRIIKWCKSNMGAYNLLKQDLGGND